MASLLKAGARGRALRGARELEALELARRTCVEAEEAGARIVSEARAQAASLREEAARAGHGEGLARAAGELLAVARAREDRLSALEGELAAAALEVARAVLGLALAADPGAVLELARRALQRVRDRREVILRVHPDDAVRLGGELAGLGALLERAPGLAVRADPGLSPGAVVVETEAGRVDARVDSQLRLLERALLEEGR